MVKLSEVKISAATAMAAAFGFVIALIWKDVIIELLKYAGLWQEAGFSEPIQAVTSIVMALVITFVCVVGIIYISKWGGVEK